MEQTVTTRLGGVPSGDVPLVWDRVYPFLEEAAAHTRGEFPLHYLWEALQRREVQMWVLFDVETDEPSGVCITRVEKYTDFNICQIIVASGATHLDWNAALPTIERWAAAHGAKYLRWWGRPGTKKRGEAVGFKQDYVVLTKELDAQLH